MYAGDTELEWNGYLSSHNSVSSASVHSRCRRTHSKFNSDVCFMLLVAVGNFMQSAANAMGYVNKTALSYFMMPGTHVLAAICVHIFPLTSFAFILKSSFKMENGNERQH